MTYPAPVKLHDCSYLGDTFREHQSIARRQVRVRERAMNPRGSSDSMCWISQTYDSAQEAL
ncbi:hypothetical protein LZG37_23970 [Halomonas titanicae]|uniref:hypothetical protein n=1 Tax=Vreelandella titanicae TaxID=664683 RepID=UPI001F35470A|nr:hypothetical protein [Halomonas titanicae]MCE7521196.1 hypothetical protein [Halomonas titanicae]